MSFRSAGEDALTQLLEIWSSMSTQRASKDEILVMY